MLNVRAMDHIVLNVEDMEAVLRFYIDVLGLPGERVEQYRAGEAPFPSLRISPDTLIDLFPRSEEPEEPEELTERRSRDLHHFCLVIDKTDMQRVIEHLGAHGVPVANGPVPRWGARGNGSSIYVEDPEGRPIEIRYYDE